MIVYFKDHNVNVEVPDDMSDADIAELGQNLPQYTQDPVQNQTIPEGVTPASDSSTPNPTDIPLPPNAKIEMPQEKWTPNFWESDVKPFLDKAYGVYEPMAKGLIEQNIAFTAGAEKEFTMGLTPVEKIPGVENIMKRHPISTAVGRIGGGIGSFAITGGILEAAGLGRYAIKAGQAATAIPGIVGQVAPRFLPRFIMSAGTFGTHSFAKSTIKEFQDGNIDPGKYGEGLLNETNWGAYLRILENTGKETIGGGAIGAIGGIAGGWKGLAAAVGSAATVGYSLSRWEGGDHNEGLLNAAIFAGFELIGGYGRDTRLAREAQNNVIESLAEYYMKKNPGVSPTEARIKAGQYYHYLSKDVRGFNAKGQPVSGPEAVVTQENALRKLEKFNQAVRNGQVSSPAGSEGFKPIEIAGPKAEEGVPAAESHAPPAPRLPEESLRLIENAGPEGKVVADSLRAKYESEDLAMKKNVEEPAPTKPVNVTPPAPGSTKVGEVRISDDEQFSPVKMIPIQDLRAGQFTVDPRIVKSYVEKIQAGQPIEPMVVERRQDVIQIQDGHHRGEAMAQLGYKEMPVVFVEENAKKAREEWKQDYPKLPFPEETLNQDSAKYPDYPTGDFKRENQDTGDFARTKSPHTANENDPEYQKAELIKALGPLKYVKAVAPPELYKLYKALAGNEPLIQHMAKNLMGFLRPRTGTIHLNKEIFKDPNLLAATFAHEIGHLFGYMKSHSLGFGNILGHLAYELDYGKHLIPNAPNAPEGLLTDADRARLKAEAKLLLKKGGKTEPELPENQFDPQAVMNVWNRVMTKLDPKDEALLEYIKRLNTEQKKAIVKQAMKALAAGEKSITINGVGQFNKKAQEDPEGLADILKDLIEKEIKRRGLFEIETMEKELKALTHWWSPEDLSIKPNMSPQQIEAIKKHIAYRESPKELYAEFVSVMLNAPLKAKQMAPKAFEMFYNYLDNNPKVAKAFFEVQQMIQMGSDELNKLRLQDHLAMYKNAQDVENQILAEKALAEKSPLWKLYHGVVNQAGDIFKLAKELKDRDPNYTPEMDAGIAFDRLGTIGSYENYLVGEFENKVYTPAMALGDSPFVKADGTRATAIDLIGLQMELDRVSAGDRKPLANPLFTTPESAKEGMDYLHQQYPDYMAKIDQIVEAMRDFHIQIFDEPGAKDAFTPQQIKTGKENRKYATYRVTQYLDQWMSGEFEDQGGTIKEIGNPLINTLRKTVKAALMVRRNYFRNIIINTIKKGGLDITPAKITYAPAVDKDGNTFIKPNIQPPPSHKGMIVTKEGGKVVGYHTDKTIADMVRISRNSEISDLGASISLLLGNQFFRGFFIDWNPGFQLFNFMNDAMSTWTNTPNLTLPQLLKSYWEAIGPKFKTKYGSVADVLWPIEFTGPAAQKARGEYNPLVQEIAKAGGFQPTLSQIMSGRTQDDDLLELYLQQHGVLKPEGKYEKIPIINWLVRLANTMQTNGYMIEAIPKIVSWQANKKSGESEAANVSQVLTRAGTPIFSRKGSWTPVTNAAFMFSNINLRGIERTIDLYTTNNKRDRDTFYRRSLILLAMSFMPMLLATMKMLGTSEEERARNKRLMDMIPEYHKTNYNIILLGETKDHRAMYIKLGIPHEQRLLRAIMWKMINHEGNIMKNLSEFLAVGQQQLPSVAPAVNIISTLSQYAIKGNAYDTYRGQNILTQDEADAGGIYAFIPMAKWTFNQFGLVRLNIHDSNTQQPITRELMSWLPGLSRLIGFSDQGQSEKLHDSTAETVETEARIQIHYEQEAKDSVAAGLTQEEHLEKATPAKEQTKLKRLVGEEVSVDEKPELDENRAKLEYQKTKKFFNQTQIVRSLRAARTDNQKVVMLLASAEMWPLVEGQDRNTTFTDAVDALMENKIITRSVARRVKDVYEIRTEEQ